MLGWEEILATWAHSMGLLGLTVNVLLLFALEMFILVTGGWCLCTLIYGQ